MKNLGVILFLAAAGVVVWLMLRPRNSVVASTATGNGESPVQIRGGTVTNEDSTGEAVAALAQAVAGKNGVGTVTFQSADALLTIQSQDEAAKRAAVEKEFYRVQAAPNGAKIAASWGSAENLWEILTSGEFSPVAPVLQKQIRARVGL